MLIIPLFGAAIWLMNKVSIFMVQTSTFERWWQVYKNLSWIMNKQMQLMVSMSHKKYIELDWQILRIHRRMSLRFREGILKNLIRSYICSLITFQQRWFLALMRLLKKFMRNILSNLKPISHRRELRKLRNVRLWWGLKILMRRRIFRWSNLDLVLLEDWLILEELLLEVRTSYLRWRALSLYAQFVSIVFSWIYKMLRLKSRISVMFAKIVILFRSSIINHSSPINSILKCKSYLNV